MPPSATEQVVRLTADEVALACAVLTLPGHELLERAEARAVLDGLVDAGVVDEDGALVEPAATIVRVLAGAEVKLGLRVWRAGTEVVEYRLWADERDAVAGHVSPSALDLKLISWTHLPLAAAALLGLDGVGVAVEQRRDPLSVAPAQLLAARSMIQSGDRGAARAALDEQDAEHGDAAFAIAEELRVVWSVAAAWCDPGGTAHGGSLSALDAGPWGWWLLEPGAELAKLDPSDPQALWAALHALLPSEAPA